MKFIWNLAGLFAMHIVENTIDKIKREEKCVKVTTHHWWGGTTVKYIEKGGKDA